MDRNDRTILILGILILILLAVGYYFLLFSPLRQEYLDAYQRRGQKEQQKAQLEQKVAQLENVRRNAPDIERQILEISKRIPEQDEIPTLVVQIEEIARGTDVTQFQITAGNPESPPGGGDFSRIPITMFFTGTYEDMQDFLLRLRNLARLVTVNEVSYCRRPQPVTPGLNCPFEIEGLAKEGTVGDGGGEDPREDPLEVQIQAEVYVQPAAGGEGTTAGEATAPGGGGATTPGGGGATTPGGGAAKNGAKAKEGGAPK